MALYILMTPHEALYILMTPHISLYHNPAEADKSEGGGDARQVGQEASRGAGRGAG